MRDWNSVAAGALGGAVIAVIAVFALSAGGLMPSGQREAQIHDYLLAHPDILIAMSQKLQSQQQQSEEAARQAAVDRLGVKAFFDSKLAFITGPANAKNTVVEFFDYNCPYCRSSSPSVQAYYNAHKADTRFAFIEFPVKGEESVATSKLAIAARKQPDKYLAFHFAMMRQEGLMTLDSAVAIAKQMGINLDQLQKDVNDPSVAATIASAEALAHAAGVDGTPAFVINGKIREGTVTRERLAAMARR